MTVILNGERKTIEGPSSAGELLAGLGVKPGSVICVLNGSPLSEEELATPLKDGDQIDILQFAGGG